MCCEEFIPELLSTDFAFITQNRKPRSFERKDRYIYCMQIKISALAQQNTIYLFTCLCNKTLHQLSFILLQGSPAFLKQPQSDCLPSHFSKKSLMIFDWSINSHIPDFIFLDLLATFDTAGHLLLEISLYLVSGTPYLPGFPLSLLATLLEQGLAPSKSSANAY